MHMNTMKTRPNNKTYNSMKRIITLRAALMLAIAASTVLPMAAQDQLITFFAHRGSRYEFDENTLDAFQKCYDSGLRGYETDMRMTSDGEILITHDERLGRITPCNRKVEELTAAEIRKLRTNKGNKMMFLPELVDFLADKDSLYVEFEMKTQPESSYPAARLEEYCNKIYTAIMASKPASSTYVFTSKDTRALKMMQKLYPGIDLLYIMDEPVSEQSIIKAIDMGVKRIGCRMEGTSKKAVQLAKKAGLIVALWPGPDENAFMLGAYLGADAMCCDRAVQVKKFLDEKALWIRYK